MNISLAQTAREDICLAVHGLKELPALSPMSTTLLGLIGDENVSIHQLADIIRQDASLGARIIGLANSAYFGQREPITSVEDAIFKALGLRLTQNLALSIALSGPFSSHIQCDSFDLQGFWMKAVLTANLAQSLCGFLNVQEPVDTNTAYLAGLLHEFGLLPLVYLYPQQMDAIFNQRKEHYERLHILLKKEVNTDQHEVGACLAKKWQIPSIVVDVIAHHADTNYHGEHEALVLLVHFCCIWATQYLDEGLWDQLPEETEHLLKYSNLDEEKLLKLLKKQHAKSAAFESMAAALVGN